MKNLLVATFLCAFSTDAFADYGSLKCKNDNKNIELTLEETSDIKSKNVTLKVAGKTLNVSRVSVTQTEYGVLGIDVQVGKGSLKYIYSFGNLGSGECFSVYESEQKGLARVKVINSLGTIATINCKCNQY